MGDGASDAIRSFVRGGMPGSGREPRRRKPVKCPDCDKVLYGIGGLMQHQNAKHGARHSWSSIVRAPVQYEGE